MNKCSKHKLNKHDKKAKQTNRVRRLYFTLVYFSLPLLPLLDVLF